MKKSNALQDLKPPIRGLILDMDGVLWKDATPIGDLSRIFDRIRSAGLKAVLATNNATLTVDQYIKKMAGFGVVIEPWQVVTSGLATAETLNKAFPQKGVVFVVGENGLTAALREAGFTPITDPEDATPAVAVVAGFDRSLTYQKLSRAMRDIRSGARFYGTNPDVTFPTPDGLVPGAGSIIAALQAATGQQPVVIGKPAPAMFRLCAGRMQLDMADVLVVGDRLETDIAGAQAVGARSAVVLSGVSSREQAEAWKPKPTLVAADLSTLLGA